ncbi:MAG: polyribonucleotide nucleotidyltransferase [Rickettsiaceae bacterium]
MFNEIIKQTDWNGETLELSTGKIARQADGAVIVKMGDTIVQCTSVSAKEANPEASFFPLTINYQEKSYAAGKIPGGFFKREGRGSEKEILVSRLIDRPIRPLFHPGFLNETQILCTVHSFDPRYSPDILALIGASAALAISGVPYLDIVAASRVGMIDGEFILNPTHEQLQNSSLDLVVAGTKESVMMVESEADFLSEKQMLDAVQFGHDSFQKVIALIEELKAEAGKPAWSTVELFPAALKNTIGDLVKSDITKAFLLQSKADRQSAFKEISTKVKDHLSTNEQEYTAKQIASVLSELKSDILRADMMQRQARVDGRSFEQIRQIASEVSIFPGTHGSSLFTRGDTQAVVTTTLGTGQDEQIIDCIEGEYKESFLLNYLFPAYSVGEANPMRGPSRREVGHGKLAWRALKRALPTKSDFPYTIRVVSEISESNGSSSMATVCGGSMAMMDAGVPLKSPIAGIAMGLIKEGDQFIILSDIIADEDYLGDMDFKVAGSSDGITALQMDIKVTGIDFNIIGQALDQAKSGRVHILGKMNQVIASNSAISGNAPVIESFMVPKEKIREIIGAGGKVIREICDTTGAKIDITDEGLVSVSAVGQDKLDAAVLKVKEIAIDPEIGDIFEGKVVKILDAGAFVNYMGSRDGFVHISEISHERIASVSVALTEGQQVKVKLIGFDRGKAKLTIKNIDNEGAPQKEVESKKETQAPKEDTKKRRNEQNDKTETSARNKKWKSNNADSKKATDVVERKYFS